MSGPLHRFKPQRLLPRSWRRGDRVYRERSRAMYWERAAHGAEHERDFWRAIAQGHARKSQRSMRRDWLWVWVALVVAGIGAGLMLGRTWR